MCRTPGHARGAVFFSSASADRPLNAPTRAACRQRDGCGVHGNWSAYGSQILREGRCAKRAVEPSCRCQFSSAASGPSVTAVSAFHRASVARSDWIWHRFPAGVFCCSGFDKLCGGPGEFGSAHRRRHQRDQGTRRKPATSPVAPPHLILVKIAAAEEALEVSGLLIRGIRNSAGNGALKALCRGHRAPRVPLEPRPNWSRPMAE